MTSVRQKTIYWRLSEDEGYLLIEIRGQSVCYGPAGFSWEVRICLSLLSFSLSAHEHTRSSDTVSVFIFDQSISTLRSMEFFFLQAIGHAPIWIFFFF